MSSMYHALCVNHDPAIVVDGDWQRPEVALEAVANRDAHEVLRSHRDCDLLVGRYSYPLIEVCCPGGQHVRGQHTDARWMDRDWLRVLHFAHAAKDPAIARAVLDLAAGCWSHQRLHRLRFELLIEAPDA